jgi:hypothetical protein
MKEPPSWADSDSYKVAPRQGSFKATNDWTRYGFTVPGQISSEASHHVATNLKGT